MIDQQDMNTLVQWCALEQNNTMKLNAGMWREAIRLTLKNLGVLLLEKYRIKHITAENKMPAKKKASAKKAKPMPKPKGK